MDLAAAVLKAYKPGETSLRDVAHAVKTDHHRVKRILTAHGVPVVRAKRKPFTDAHRQRISDSTKGRVCWAKGKKMSRDSVLKNMAAHLRFDVDIEWLRQFEDFDRLKFLNRAVTERGSRFQFSTEDYRQYIERFYSCERFMRIYTRWLESGKEFYRTPSLDHIVPVSKGGAKSLENLQFLTWFENRCKNDLPQEDWNLLKLDIESYFL